jgi:hypothetical protein
MENKEKIKFFIFSDESGSWHDDNDVYVRAWVVITEEEYEKKLRLKVDEINSFRDSRELKWKGFEEKYFNYFDEISFRLFITISSPGDIDWEHKYKVTKSFEESVRDFNFGDIDEDLKTVLRDRMYRDIKNVLFLHYYERHHIENAKKGIERVIKSEDYELVYRIDPPQLSQSGWKHMLQKISGNSNVNLEFPKSQRTPGIQFADLIAGATRSLLIDDHPAPLSNARKFIEIMKKSMISSKWGSETLNPNPNLIFFGEINDALKEKIKGMPHN